MGVSLVLLTDISIVIVEMFLVLLTDITSVSAGVSLVLLTDITSNVRGCTSGGVYVPCVYTHAM